MSWAWIGLMISVSKIFNESLPVLKIIALNALVIGGTGLAAKLTIWYWPIEEAASINYIWLLALFTIYLFISNQLGKSKLLLIISNLSLINFSGSLTLIVLFILNRLDLIDKNFSIIFSWTAMIVAFTLLLSALGNRLQVVDINAQLKYRAKGEDETIETRMIIHYLPKTGFIIILLGLSFLAIGQFLKPEFKDVFYFSGGIYAIVLGIGVWLADILFIMWEVAKAFLLDFLGEDSQSTNEKSPKTLFPKEPINFGY
ncbi:MAG: hypothetical protein WC467_01130 [Patescibacteria group bacterium]